MKNSKEHAVGAASASMGLAMLPGKFYLYVANVDSWIAQGATPTASAAAGSMFVPAGLPILILGNNGADLATIEDVAAGKASLTPCAVA
jgi:hypothetical protein